MKRAAKTERNPLFNSSLNLDLTSQVKVEAQVKRRNRPGPHRNKIDPNPLHSKGVKKLEKTEKYPGPNEGGPFGKL
jgi:hypothetical protein